MFVVLGIVFIVLEGANPAAGIYDAVGLADLSVALQTALLNATSGMAPAIPSVIGLAVVAAAAAAVLMRRRRTRATG